MYKGSAFLYTESYYLQGEYCRCTNGRKTPEEAVAEYQDMNYRSIKEKEYIEKYEFDNFCEYAAWNGVEYVNTEPAEW